MKLIGLTGGIGSGKSTVAQLLLHHGWELVDADQIARDIVEPGQPALAELADAFGEDILQADGSLDRGLLASRAFASREKTDLLNSITHPRIQEETQARFDSARRAGADFVVYDMPLLVDKGLHKIWTPPSSLTSMWRSGFAASWSIAGWMRGMRAAG